jgi:diguanylate cyclase (GGDEF)-like protein/PAS domain S-box-containing protein
LLTAEILEALIDHSFDAFALCNKQAKVIYDSWRNLDHDDLEPGGLTGKLLYSFCSPEDQIRVATEINKILKFPGRSAAVEVAYQDKSGTKQWVELKAVNYLDNPGINYLLVTYRKITGQKLSEHQCLETKNRLEMMVEAAHVGIWEWDPATNLVYWSERLKEMFLPKELHSQSWLERSILSKLIHPQDSPTINQTMEKYFRERGEYKVEFRIKTLDGEYRWMRGYGKALWDEENKPIRFVGSIHDIHKEKVAELILLENTKILAESQRMSKIGSFSLNLEASSLQLSANTYEIFGLKEGYETSFESVRKLVHPDDLHSLVEETFLPLTRQEINTRETILRIIRPSGEERTIRVNCEIVTNKDGQPWKIIGALQDITELQRKQADLQREAHIDGLTGLPNRKKIMLEIDKLMATDVLFGVLFLDLDRFKIVNDSLGHLAGDQLLQQVATRLRSIRSDVLVGRLGGDEFVILVPYQSTERDLQVLAGSILKSFKAPFEILSKQLIISPSVGLVVRGKDMGKPHEVLQAADMAMYQAKQGGRGKYAEYTQDLQKKAIQTLHLEAEMRRAVEKDELQIHWHPIVELQSGKIIANEALLRWQNPRLGLIGPSEFMHLAEETGVVGELDEWSSIQAAKAWLSLAPEQAAQTKIAVNFSRWHIQRKKLVEVVDKMISKTGIDPAAVQIELTENLLLADLEQTITALKDLRKLGVELALDDFGTGYSSLTYLFELPLDVVKIDQGFIRQLKPDQPLSRTNVLCREIIRIGNELNLQIIAEGIETKEHLEILKEWGCYGGQGYFWTKPLPSLKDSVAFGKQEANQQKFPVLV